MKIFYAKSFAISVAFLVFCSQFAFVDPATSASKTISPAPTPVLVVQTTDGPNAGSEISANIGKWMSGVKLTYQWNLEGVPIIGANKTTIVVPKATGKTLTLTVTGKKNWF